MWLKADAAHRRGDAELRQIARAPLQRLDQAPAPNDDAQTGDVDSFAGRAKRPLEQRCRIRIVFGHDRHRFGGKSRLLQCGKPLFGPGGVLKNCDGEESGVSEHAIS